MLRTIIIFHVNEISFCVPFWDTLRACVQSILPMAISSFHLFSCVWLCATPGSAVHQDSLSITNSQSLLKLMSIESVMPSNHLILCCPFLLLPSIFPSIRVFSNESGKSNESFHQVVKVLELQLQHQSFQLIFGVDSFQDWLVWSLCSPRDSQESSQMSQFKNINFCSAFFIFQLSHLYMTIGKTMALTQWTFIGKVMSLLFNTWSKCVSLRTC